MKPVLIVSHLVRKGNAILILLKLFILYLQTHFHINFSSTNHTNIMGDFLANLAALILQNVNFSGNAQLETLTEAFGQRVADVTAAGIEFKTLAGDNAATVAAGNSLISLAGELGTAFPHLTQPQADRFKDIVSSVYDNPDPAVDAAAQNLFNKSVDAVVACQALSDFVNTPV